MAVGLSGWAHHRTAREGSGSRAAAHAEVQRAEAALAAQQEALRLALADATGDLEALLASMQQAEDALIDARKAWSAAAGVGVAAAQPVRTARPAFSLDRQVKRARRASAPRPSFTYGSWV